MKKDKKENKDIVNIASRLTRWIELKSDQGCSTQVEINKAVSELDKLIKTLRNKQIPAEVKKRQPAKLKEIRDLRPKGPRKLSLHITESELEDKILGALLGRAAGCVLGIPVECMTKQQIVDAAIALGQRYPLNDYWKIDPCPHISSKINYETTPRKEFLKANLGSTGADDDLVYTILGLLIVEDYGIDFTSEDIGKAWVKYLPFACTAEQIALEALRKGGKPPKTAMGNNPFVEWIGADIRSDPWAYVAPALPELAAELAYRDARISHFMNGVYGEMFFSAAISAAFATEDIDQIIKIGLFEIPKDCQLARGIRQTLRWIKKDQDWDKTIERILKQYSGMHVVHTINNAAVTVAGLVYGRGDFEKTITLTVMAGLDTDCTGATAGSIVGAIKGAKRLPRKWTRPLGDSILTYMKLKKPSFKYTVLAKRFTKQAVLVRKMHL